MKAVYAAIFRLREQKTIEVGALGELEFAAGYYIYVGSAMTNVEKRLERHFSDVENIHWHIDYFSGEAEAVDYLVLPEGSSDYECFLSDAVRRGAEPVHEFGASDCGCRTHLYHVEADEL